MSQPFAEFGSPLVVHNGGDARVCEFPG